MKKYIAFLGILSITVAAISCTPKASKPLTQEEDTHKAYKDFVKSFNEDAIANGKNIHDSSCGKCHKLKDIANFSIEKWDTILDRMIPKAKLSADDGQLVRAYVYSLKLK